MREIKFKAYFEKYKRMIENICILPNDMILVKFNYNGEYEQLYWLNDIHLMQYTGLKDINGKEIYEGDILKSNTEVTIIDTVVFDEDNARFGIKGKSDEICILSKDKIQYLKFEVIGNIFENKELLE